MFCSTTTLGQEKPDFVPDVVEKSFDKSKKPGWHVMLKGSGTLAFTHSKNVVGAADGSTWNLGLLANASADYRHKRGHIWENDLKWQLTYTKAPAMELFLKSLDDFDFKSGYLYEIPKIDWVGAFGSFRVKTALLPGYTVRSADLIVMKRTVDDETVDHDAPYEAQSKIPLSGSFSPLTLRETVGVFANPLKKELMDFEVRLGAGAWEIFGDDAFNIEKEDATTMTLREVESSVQLGAELELKAKGAFKKLVNYGLGIGFMYPFWHNATTDLEGLDLLNMEFEFLLGIKFAEWASLDYRFKAQQYPLIVDDWQLSNALLLTLTANIL